MTKRILISTTTGALLGIFCIIGVGVRTDFEDTWFLFAMWWNRVVMGVVFGVMSDEFKFLNNKWNFLIRGALVGGIISSAIFITSEFRDIPAFFAGVVYGVIIDYITTKFSK